MAGFSKYPGQIDTSTELPPSTDNVTPVKAEVVNRLRDAILAIEAELGVNPSGVFGTVRDRLDSLGSGSGGGGAIAVQLNGSLVNANILTLDFAGDVNVSTESPTRALITIGGNTKQKQETVSVSNNQTLFTLSSTPVQSNAVQMYLNGIKQDYGSDYTASGKVVLYSGSIALTSTDQVEFWYLINNDPVVPVQYTTTLFRDLPTPTDGETSFTISQFPFQNNAVEMYVNGSKLIYGTDYTVSSKTVSYIGAVSILSTDLVEFEYFTDASFVPTASSTSYNQTSIKTGTYTAVIADFVRCDPSSGGFTVNLPSAAGLSMQSIIVKNITSSSNSITVKANGSQTIDGSNTQIINAGFESFTLYSNGTTNWDIV